MHGVRIQYWDGKGQEVSWRSLKDKCNILSKKLPGLDYKIMPVPKGYGIHLAEKQENLDNLLSEIFPIIGIPSFIEAGPSENYALIERELAKYGKTLRYSLRDILTLSQGKRVVDVKRVV